MLPSLSKQRYHNGTLKHCAFGSYTVLYHVALKGLSLNHLPTMPSKEEDISTGIMQTLQTMPLKRGMILLQVLCKQYLHNFFLWQRIGGIFLSQICIGLLVQSSILHYKMGLQNATLNIALREKAYV